MTGKTNIIQYAQVKVPYPSAIKLINPNCSAKKMQITIISELIINLYIPDKIIFFSINQLAILSLNPCISPNPVSTNVPNKII